MQGLGGGDHFLCVGANISMIAMLAIWLKCQNKGAQRDFVVLTFVLVQ